MVGQLAVSFCERKEGETCVCLDVWAYPDGTYNLVIENFGTCTDREFAFPCSFHQLAGVLSRKSLVSESEVGMVTIERCGSFVCAQFDSSEGQDGFSHCIGFEEFRRAIEALESDAVGYLA